MYHIFLVTSNYMVGEKKKASRFKNFPPSLYIPLSLLSEAVLKGNLAMSVFGCALCWCGVMLHRSMQHRSIWNAF